MMTTKNILPLVAVMALAACSGGPSTPVSIPEATMTLSITSSAFAHGQPIPVDYSCDGKGISPSLAWSGAPAGTKSFALIMDDPDAPSGTFVHWVIYNIPPTSTGLPESMASDASLPDGSIQGPSSGRRTGYIPPCPPGGTHRYFLKLYALDTMLHLTAGGKSEVLAAMETHVLAQGELMGTYTRK